MSESSELDEIRERKLEELKASLRGEPTPGDDGVADTAPDEPIYVTGADHFQEVLGEHDVVLVDFYADWCGPCQMLEPTIEALAADTDAAVAKVDIDAHQGLARQFSVRGVPTVIVFADGSPAERVSGVRDRSFYTQLLAQHAG